jgi:hypothetical protein
MRHTFASQLNNINTLRYIFALPFSKRQPPKTPLLSRFLCLSGPKIGGNAALLAAMPKGKLDSATNQAAFQSPTEAGT